MKAGVMLINTGRLVDSRALIDALKRGQVGAAGLDVYEEEEGIFFRNLSEQVSRELWYKTEGAHLAAVACLDADTDDSPDPNRDVVAKPNRGGLDDAVFHGVSRRMHAVADHDTVAELQQVVIYPLLTVGVVHGYPAAPTFGVPCPTAILTIGLLLTAHGGVPVAVAIVPALWGFVADLRLSS